MKHSIEEIQKLEKAIQDKYGLEAVKHPRSEWTPEKEQEYIRQLKERAKKKRKIEEKIEKLDDKGFFVYKKLVTEKGQRDCPICDTYSFSLKDDVYMKKFECCYMCYVQYIEGREEKWPEKKKQLLEGKENGFREA